MGGGLQCQPLVSAIAPHELGVATLTPVGDFEAGAYQTFTLIYTAGKYGIDDSGSLRVCFRFASDQSRRNSRILLASDTRRLVLPMMPFCSIAMIPRAMCGLGIERSISRSSMAFCARAIP